MKIIALDSSGLVASAAIVEADTVIAEYSTQYKKTHSQTLLPMLAEITKMTDTDLSSVDAIAISAGPGSFTGLRIGSALVKGLGMALDKPLIEIPTADGLAVNLYGTDKLVCPLMDARRNQVYTGIYCFEKENATEEVSPPESENSLRPGPGNSLRPEPENSLRPGPENNLRPEPENSLRPEPENISSPELGNDSLRVRYRMNILEPQCAVDIGTIVDKLNKIGREVIFLGDGVPVFAERLRELMKVPYSFAPAHMNRQRAAAMAFLARQYWAEGKTVTAAEHTPIYLRLSQAEREKAAQAEESVIPKAEQSKVSSVVPPTEQSDEMAVMPPTEQSDEMAVMPPTEQSDEMAVVPPTEQSDGMAVMPPTEQSDEMAVIRPMAQGDVAAISIIEAQVFSMPWKARDFLEMIADDHAYYYVAVIGGQPIGACGLRNVVGEGQITNVLVAEEYRRRGIARRLLERMLAEAVREGMNAFVLEVRSGNQAAIGLYESLGFKTVGRRPDFYEKPSEDALIMLKNCSDLK